MSDFVLVEIADRIGWVTLNRPDKLNALNYALIDRFMDALHRLERADEVAAVVLTGAGDRAFSAGADIAEFAADVERGATIAIRDFVTPGQAMTARLETFPKPVIAAVNGLAFGGGCEIVEAAHLAVASERALFAKSEIALGMPPTFGGTQRLPRLVGRKRGLEMLLTGDPVTAERALGLGLINAVVAPDQVHGAARDLARRITRHSPLAVQAILTAVSHGSNVGIGEGLQMEREQFARMVPTRDLDAGLKAWKHRRAPVHAGE